ncbi:MAG TPA: glycosyltransferase [Steroidobacteraceae bacterium]|jgi:glycosyltransferase involved in cell wall biosynthesis|nr:glycosyltransferase [Steroidobacteraceae bacterium]
MRILTNFLDAPGTFILSNGEHVEVTKAESIGQLRKALRRSDLLIIDCRGLVIYKLAALLFLPWNRTTLVAVDIVLRKPLTARHKATALIKRHLLKRVDHFLHYFRDLTGYSSFFGVSESRSSYVPFKSNLYGEEIPANQFSEDYIFAMGLSLRDYDTFIRAIAGLPYPAAIPRHSLMHFEGRPHDFRWQPGNLPPNLQLLPDGGTQRELIEHLSKARIVVVPIQGHSLCASGISTYLDAMYLGKSVIITEGPGASDLLTNQALLVPAHDVAALIFAIKQLWEDNSLREAIATAGHAYARALGNESALLKRIFQRSVDAVAVQQR